MLTEGTNSPIEANGGASSAVMMSIADIAARDGVSKPTVSIAVKRLVERHNLSVQRDRQGRVALVNVVQYDRMRGEHGDLSRAQSPEAAAARGGEIEPGRSSSDPVYTREQARSMAYKAELLRLELQEKEGKIVSVEIVRASAVRAGEEIVRIIDRLPQAADDLVVALNKGGAHGVRLALKRIGLAMRRDVADALAQATAESLRAAPLAVPSGSEDTASPATTPPIV